MKDILLADIINASANISTDKAVLTVSLVIFGVSWIFCIISAVLDHYDVGHTFSCMCFYTWTILCFLSVVTLVIIAAHYMIGSFKLDQMILSYEAVYGPLPGGII